MKSTISYFVSCGNFLVIVAAISFCLFAVACEEPPVEDVDAVAFVDVNVVPMDQEGLLEEYTVIVQNGRIAEAGPSNEVDVPAGATLVDGTGRYLMPGLAEMHGHIPGPDNPDYAEGVLFLYISNGVTTVRNMAGHPYHLELRERVERGEVPGPAIYAASPWMSANQAPTPEDVDRLVREHKEAGFDLMKMGSISLEVYHQMAETAHEVSIPFAGHIPEEVGLVRALDARQASIDHFDR